MKDLSYWKARHITAINAKKQARSDYQACLSHRLDAEVILAKAEYCLDMAAAIDFAEEKIEAIESQILVNKP